MTRRPDSVGGEEGFTLVELVVAMTLSIVVLFAILGAFDSFTVNAARQTRVNDGNDQARRLMEATVRDLRQAGRITNAQPQDLIYTVPEPGGVVRTRRLCVAGGRLYEFSTQSPTPAPTAATPCAAGGSSLTLRAGSLTAFTYDGATSSSSPGTVRNVGLTLSLDTSGHGRASQSTLTASATRRTGRMLLTDDDLKTTCTPQGPLLTLGAGLVDIPGIRVEYLTEAGALLGVSGPEGLTVPLGVTKVVARVTDADGLSVDVQREVDCA